MKLKQKLEEYEDIEVPYYAWTAFGDKCKYIKTLGDQASLGEDYMSLEDLRKAIQFYVDQLGGKVKWEKTKKKL